MSDRIENWRANYRDPDIAVDLPENPAAFCKAHICGGPDFAVEILSGHDLARQKLDLYAKVNTRELLLLDRNPWALQLFPLIDGRLERVGISTVDRPDTLTSTVFPLTLKLLPGKPGPSLELTRLDGGQAWRI